MASYDAHDFHNGARAGCRSYVAAVPNCQTCKNLLGKAPLSKLLASTTYLAFIAQTRLKYFIPVCMPAPGLRVSGTTTSRPLSPGCSLASNEIYFSAFFSFLLSRPLLRNCCNGFCLCCSKCAFLCSADETSDASYIFNTHL